MAKAYLKIDVELGKEKAVREALLSIEGVKSAHLTAGEQDLICLVESSSYESLLQLVVSQLRKIDGITGTETNLVLE